MAASTKSELLTALAKLLALTAVERLAQPKGKDSEEATANPKKDGGK